MLVESLDSLTVSDIARQTVSQARSWCTESSV